MGSPSQPAQHRSAARALTGLAAAAGLTVMAVAVAVAVRTEPLIAPAAAGALLAGVAVRRFPALALIAAFAVTGTYGTLEAFTPLPGGAALDGLLAGLWVAAAWAYLTGERRDAVSIWPGVAVLAVYLLVTLGQALTAEDLGTGLRAFHASAWYMAAGLLIAYMPWTDRARRALVPGILAVAAVVGAYAVVRLIAGPAGEETARALANAANAGYRRAGEIPLFGSLTSPKELSAWCAVVLPFALACVLGQRGVSRWLAAATGPLLVAAIFGTEARLGLLAAVSGLLAVLVLHQLNVAGRGLRLGTALATVGASLAVFVAAYAVAVGDDPGARERIGDLVAPGQIASVQERQARWEEAFRVARENPGGLGLGSAGGVALRGSDFRPEFNLQLDNSYLKIALEQGVVVGLFVAALVLLLAGLGRRALFEPDGRRATLAAGAAGSGLAFVVLMAGGLFVEGLTSLTAWILLGVGMAAFTAPRAAASTRAPARRPGAPA